MRLRRPADRGPAHPAARDIDIVMYSSTVLLEELRGLMHRDKFIGAAGSNSHVSDRPMRPSKLLALKRDAIHEAAARYRTTNPRIFGSVLHGSDRDGSDLDLLVDALPGATLFDLGGLHSELEELLGVPVDLLTPGDLPPHLRRRILAEARPV